MKIEKAYEGSRINRFFYYRINKIFLTFDKISNKQ